MLTWENLYRLQQMENVIEDKKKNRDILNKYNSLKAEKEIIQKEINALKEEKDKFDLLRKPISELESEIEDIKKLAKEHENKLYSGDITNNKELITAKEHLDHYQASIANLEDDLIKLMEEQDKGKESFEGKANLIKGKKDNFQREFNEYQKIKERETIEISEFEEELHKLKNILAVEEEEYLALYEKLKKKYNLGVIAKLENAICLGCHMGVSFEVMKELRKPDRKEPVYCNNCGRIVIL